MTLCNCNLRWLHALKFPCFPGSQTSSKECASITWEAGFVGTYIIWYQAYAVASLGRVGILPLDSCIDIFSSYLFLRAERPGLAVPPNPSAQGRTQRQDSGLYYRARSWQYRSGGINTSNWVCLARSPVGQEGMTHRVRRRQVAQAWNCNINTSENWAGLLKQRYLSRAIRPSRASYT